MRLDRITHPSASWIQDEINEKEDKKSPNFEKISVFVVRYLFVACVFLQIVNPPLSPPLCSFLAKAWQSCGKILKLFYTNYILKLD